MFFPQRMNNVSGITAYLAALLLPNYSSASALGEASALSPLYGKNDAITSNDTSLIHVSLPFYAIKTLVSAEWLITEIM